MPDEGVLHCPFQYLHPGRSSRSLGQVSARPPLQYVRIWHTRPLDAPAYTNRAGTSELVCYSANLVAGAFPVVVTSHEERRSTDRRDYDAHRRSSMKRK